MTRAALLRTSAALAAAAFVALAVVLAPSSAVARGGGGRKPAPGTVEAVLAKVDGALFFHDRQEHLDGYDVELATWSAFETDGRIEGPRRDAATRLGILKVSDGGKQRDGSRTVLSYTPACGSWTLTEIMRLEMALLARPWSEVFDASRWDRKVQAIAGGHLLALTPKKKSRGKMLAPAITKVELTVTANGHPTEGKLFLDLEVMQGEATLAFTLVEQGDLQRIEEIAHVIPSVGVEIHPVVTLTLGAEKGFDLPRHLEFRVPGRQLAHSTVEKGDSVSYLIYRDYAVRRIDEEEEGDSEDESRER